MIRKSATFELRERIVSDRLRRERDAYKWAYEYLQDRMESIGRHGWAHDCDGEIEHRIALGVPDEQSTLPFTP